MLCSLSACWLYCLERNSELRSYIIITIYHDHAFVFFLKDIFNTHQKEIKRSLLNTIWLYEKLTICYTYFPLFDQ